ncbi:MAG: hypothetical protein QXW97_04480 [Candidatus Pacearchaeota archaeon]
MKNLLYKLFLTGAFTSFIYSNDNHSFYTCYARCCEEIKNYEKDKKIKENDRDLKLKKLRLEKKLEQEFLTEDKLQKIYDSLDEFMLIQGPDIKWKVTRDKAEKFWKEIESEERKILYRSYLDPEGEYEKIEKFEKKEYLEFLNQVIKNKENLERISSKLPWEEDFNNIKSPINIALFKIFKTKFFLFAF